MERIGVAAGTEAAHRFHKLGPMMLGEKEVSMPALSDFYLDDSKMPWQDFLNYLRDFGSVNERKVLFVHLCCSAGRATEAACAVRDMGPVDRVERGAEPAEFERPAHDPGGFAQASSSVRLRMPRGRATIWWATGAFSQSGPSGRGGSTPPGPTRGGGGETAPS
jgi:hypothetical protein